MLAPWMDRFDFSFSLESTLPNNLCSKRSQVIAMRCSAWLDTNTYVGYQNATRHIILLEEGVKMGRTLLYTLSDIRHSAIPSYAYRTMETARCNLEALRSYLTCELAITSNLVDHWRTNSRGAVTMILQDVWGPIACVFIQITHIPTRRLVLSKRFHSSLPNPSA